MLNPSRLAPLLFAYLLFLQASLVFGHPIRAKKADATVVNTVHTTMTENGPVTETCEITLTPITDTNGNMAVQEVRKCFMTFDAGGGNGDGKNPGVTNVPSVSATATTPASSSASSDSPKTTPTSSPPTPDASIPTITSSEKNLPTETIVPSSAQSTPTSSPSASPAAPPSSSPTVSSSSSSSPSPAVPASSTTASTSPTSASGNATPTPSPAASAGSGSNTTPTQTPTATSDPSNTTAQGAGTSAPDSTTSATAAFQLPGKKLSVLPIGLGVFAGISVIALIVVGLVTYERTKYRKAFRQRKLAESGGAMGYGGMAQRP